MKQLLFVLVLALLGCVVATETEFDYTKLLEEIDAPDFVENFPQAASFLEVEGEGEGAIATYLPDSGPYDNPSVDTTPTQTLPESPSCTVRGQTIFEIRKMRADAKQIGMAIMYEIQIMEKRKAYIEQMTSYLNDRIRELNKVKRDLAAEQRWIQVSNQRIAELAQKEKLIKLQDVMTCITTEKERLTGESASKNTAISSMKGQADALTATIATIRRNMARLTGSPGSGSGSA